MPSSSSSPSFIPHFCPSLQKDILFVRQSDASYSKYRFNPILSKFKRFKCSDCHLEATERDLQVLGTTWSRKLQRYVISTRNVLSGDVEHYVYGEERFQQVDEQPKFRCETQNGNSTVLFVVGGVGEAPVTKVMRDSRGFLKRERYNEETQRFEEVAPEAVRFLSNQKMENGKTTSSMIPNSNSLENPEKIHKNPLESCNLNRWLSRCLLEDCRSSRSAELERDRQLECLFRFREREYTHNRKFPMKYPMSDSEFESSAEDVPNGTYEEFTRRTRHRKAEISVEEETSEPENFYDSAETGGSSVKYENQKQKPLGNDDSTSEIEKEIYEEFTRTTEYLSRKDDHYKNHDASKILKRNLKMIDIIEIRKLARLMGNSEDSDDETIVIDEELPEFEGSERTV